MKPKTKIVLDPALMKPLPWAAHRKTYWNLKFGARRAAAKKAAGRK